MSPYTKVLSSLLVVVVAMLGVLAVKGPGSSRGEPARKGAVAAATPKPRPTTANLWACGTSCGTGCTRSPKPAAYNSERDCTLAEAVSAAARGDVIALRSGSYGTWTGTDRKVTLRAAAGETMDLNLDLGAGDANFTIDGGRRTFATRTGLTIGGGHIETGLRRATIRNAKFVGELTVEGPTARRHTGTLVLDHNEHVGITGTAAIHLSYPADAHSGVTIRNSLFHDMSADGIQTGPPVDILNNRFESVKPANPSQHTDAIQLYSGCARSAGIGSRVIGNFVYDTEQAIGAFDGTCHNTITHNVVAKSTNHYLVLGGDDPGSLVAYNTLAGPGGTRQIVCGSKAGDPMSSTTIRNNIAPGGFDPSGSGPTCQPKELTDNMFGSRARGGNFNGSPRFEGGREPTTFRGYCLASRSAGLTRATDGGEVGACGGRFKGGPPNK